jgi:plasmid stabilization system protein ParE
MGKIYTVKWTLIAANEYQSAADWLIKNWNEKITIDFVIAVENKIVLLKKFLQLGNPSSLMPGCRKKLVLPYHILLYKQKMKLLKL